ncbi:hypothetical protein ACICHK_43105 (plasmid) [Streptomyces sp. AHU1]|uniref:hypothetical protein n=1 Tax=Streptomyces sp. AHU1 TaxID=3377215 RepID=UPI003877B748
MTTSAINSAGLHPAQIPGYDSAPLRAEAALLHEPLFWLGHLYSCAQSENAEKLLLGTHHDAADDFQCRLWERAEWPTFTIPLAAGHSLHIVHRTFVDDARTDYLLHHPDWDQAELLAQDDGHFMGPGLSWPELVAVADNGLPGGSTDDPHARLLLLLPAFGDTATSDDAFVRLTAALRARTAVEEPDVLASELMKDQGVAGPVHWTFDEHGFYINGGEYSFRNPANRFALRADSLARVASALAPPLMDAALLTS